MKDFLAIAQQYEADVIAGVEPACRWVRLACERNRRDRDRAAANDPLFPYAIDADKAAKICKMAEKLPHIKGPKAKVIGVDAEGRNRWAPLVLEPWQCWLFTTPFGWVHCETRLRRYRIALLLVPRKNSKSTIGAVVALNMLTADGEGGPECYSAATTRDQAKAVAEIAWEMAKRSPEFCEFYGVRVGSETTRSLAVPAMAGKFMPLSADANSLDGLNVSLAVIDELHAHKTRKVWDVLDTATGARSQPLLLPISTAGSDIAGICYEQLTYLRKILEQTLEDETYFGVEYTIDEGDDWRLESAWRKANPNYGVSVRPDDLARKAKKAVHSPAATNNFLTKHLNVWVRAESTWMPMAAWRACGNAELKIEDFIGVPCWIGVDLAETRDIAATIALFTPARDHYVAFGRFYLPQAAVDRSPIAQYAGWVRQGYLIATPGNVADYARIEADLEAWCHTFAVQEVDFDRALAQQMGQQLQAKLGLKPPVITVEQSVKVLNPAMQTLERAVLSETFQHAADPVLTWMASNVVVERNYKDEIYPRKAGGKDSNHKIDGMQALLTTLSRAMSVTEPKPSIYATRGALVFGREEAADAPPAP